VVIYSFDIACGRHSD